MKLTIVMAADGTIMPNKAIEIEAEPSNTILDVQLRIQVKWGLRASSYNLLYNDTDLLSPNLVLSERWPGICDQSGMGLLTFIMAPIFGPSGKIKHVHEMCGTTLCLVKVLETCRALRQLPFFRGCWSLPSTGARYMAIDPNQPVNYDKRTQAWSTTTKPTQFIDYSGRIKSYRGDPIAGPSQVIGGSHMHMPLIVVDVCSNKWDFQICLKQTATVADIKSQIKEALQFPPDQILGFWHELLKLVDDQKTLAACGIGNLSRVWVFPD